MIVHLDLCSDYFIRMRNSFLILIAYTFFNNIYTFENLIKFKLLKFLINIKNFKFNK